MVLHLRIPNKFLLGLFSLTGATVVGAVWTFSGDADTASKGPAVNVPVIGATYPNYNGATSTTRRGGRYVSQSSYVSQDAHAGGLEAINIPSAVRIAISVPMESSPKE